MKILSGLLALLLLSVLLLTAFEITLQTFHSPIGEEITQPKAHAQTWNYLLQQHYVSFIDLECFSLHEKRHLLDVKRLFDKIYTFWVWLSLIGISLVLFLSTLAKNMMVLVGQYLSYLILAIILLFPLLLFDFKSHFNALHQLFFLQQSWFFLEDSLLIQWFPLWYFEEFLMVVVGVFMGLTLLFMINHRFIIKQISHC